MKRFAAWILVVGALCVSAKERFVVIGDVHESTYSQNLPGQIVEINAMAPAPLFVSLLGDCISSASLNFGHTASTPKELAQMESDLKGLRAKLEPLAVPLKIVLGNHDTAPGEIDGAKFRKAFPEVPPYQAWEQAGIQFMVWNGGHDGSIDPVQRKWILEKAAAFDQNKTTVVLVHQPSIGGVVRERGIPKMVLEAFGNFRRVWLLAGHEHCNRLELFSLPGGGRLAQAVHVKSIDGYWIYETENGEIVSRSYRSVKNGESQEKLPDFSQPGRKIPLPFANRDDVLWRLPIGDDAAETAACFVRGTGGNCGTWWFYVKELVYKLPLGRFPQAGHFGILANMSKHRKTGEPVRVYVSANDTEWIETVLVEEKTSVSVYTVPTELKGSSALFVRVAGYGYGADTCIGGFALLK